MALGWYFFCIKQAAPRPSEQAHGARLALLLRLQRDNSLVVVYLGRCPRLYTFALSARVAHSGWLMRIVGNVGCIIKTIETDHYDAESHLCLKSKKVKE